MIFSVLSHLPKTIKEAKGILLTLRKISGHSGENEYSQQPPFMVITSRFTGAPIF